jgi:hypothetical protein
MTLLHFFLFLGTQCSVGQRMHGTKSQYWVGHNDKKMKKMPYCDILPYFVVINIRHWVDINLPISGLISQDKICSGQKLGGNVTRTFCG